MRLLPSDPDIATIVTRIKNNDINLQPEFQRGEVWNISKKQKLIDSILRDWHIPPVHVIELKDTAKQEVLDGQQRLVAIRDFVNGEFRVAGGTEPYNEEIAKLNGCTYHTLPPEWRRLFDQFTIRVFRITDYDPSEPGELFYRLNQPASLTAAEQRNAFFGPARQQVKELVLMMEYEGIDKSFLGFSNSRMAYDDVLARLCSSLEAGTLFEKITTSFLASRYRSPEPFPYGIIEQAQFSLNFLSESKSLIQENIRFNKATLFSWLWFVVEARKLNHPPFTPKLLGEFISFFESMRSSLKSSDEKEMLSSNIEIDLPPAFIGQLLYIYNDRTSARVADVTSVVFRDVITWIIFVVFLMSNNAVTTTHDSRIRIILRNLANPRHSLRSANAENFINDLIHNYEWGRA